MTDNQMVNEENLPPGTVVIDAATLILCRNKLDEADGCWRAGELEQLGLGVGRCEEALIALGEGEGGAMAIEAGLVDERARLAAALWLKRGHLLETAAARTGEGARVLDALRGYDRALALLEGLPADAPARGESLAGAWMNRGNALLKLGSEPALAEAVRCYERTLALSETPAGAEGAAEQAERLASMRGAAWLNLGAAKQAAGAAAAELRAVYERAVAELEPMAARHPAARRSLAAAWTNLGLAREPVDAAGALAAHEEAFRLGAEQAGPRERCALLVNLGRARGAAANDAAAGRADLLEALALAAPAERREPAAADAAQQARHALCVALARRGGPAAGEARAEAEGLVEAGLALEAAWAGRGWTPAETSSRIFEYGLWLHGAGGHGGLCGWLERRLTEAPAATWTEARARLALQALGRARQALLQRGFEVLLGAGGDLARLRELESAIAATTTAAYPPVAPANGAAGEGAA